MNYLGHLYLAGGDPELQLGGLIGDFVRGSNLSHLPPGIERGIRLHRAIDRYGDAHPAFLQSRQRLPASLRRYAGILIDIYYGHLLACDWPRYHPVPLPDYSRNVYSLWSPLPAWLPAQCAPPLLHLSQLDLLTSYATLAGTEAALVRVSRRLRSANPVGESLPALLTAAEELEADFASFLPAMERFASDWLDGGR